MVLSGPHDPERLGSWGLNLSFSCPGPGTHGRPALFSAFGRGVPPASHQLGIGSTHVCSCQNGQAGVQRLHV